MAEGLSAGEVGKEIAEHREHTSRARGHEHAQRDQCVSIVEAILLSIVALARRVVRLSAAKWGTESSLSLAKASSTRTKASLAQIQTTQIRTLDSVSFNAAETAYAANDAKLFRLAVKRLRPGYKPAFAAWLALRPLKNPKAPPDPSYMKQYRIPQEAAGAGAHRVRPTTTSPKGSRRRRRRTSTCVSPCSWRRCSSCRHRQPLSGPRGALWSGRGRRRTARRIGGATARPSRTTVVNFAIGGR